MLKIPTSIQLQYQSFLKKKGIPHRYQQHYLKWLRYYLDFCYKYQLDRLSNRSLGPFLRKLAEKKQMVEQQQQARKAIGFFHELMTTPGMRKP
ncbi:MAG: phage integrase N-terminal SAM-like domain-containing protein [Deltaproteobacteria bacterium]|nr:phage integrase N-terminal SAM-like domain-containing protein [Deltaproteobacteria bacterium]